MPRPIIRLEDMPKLVKDRAKVGESNDGRVKGPFHIAYEEIYGRLLVMRRDNPSYNDVTLLHYIAADILEKIRN